MKIENFGVEMWMNEYENHCTYNLAETCVESLTIRELAALTEQPDQIWEDILQMQMTYGDIEGSPRLKKAIASLYQNVAPEQISVTHGAIGANALTMLSLVEPGDHVISIFPTYQQLYSIPESFGAKVDRLTLQKEEGWLPNLTKLEELASSKTKLICINNPNNPTGAVISEDMLREIVQIAKKCDAYLLCDEVYRGLVHQGNPFSPSVADLYDKGISNGSMSKTFSLAGLRLGWTVGPKEYIEKVSHQRDYHVISVGKIDDYLSALALENKDKIIERNLTICRTNAQILADWVKNEPHISYVPPQGGTTAFLQYDMQISSVDLCRTLQKETGVMLLPGSAMEMEGYLRIGYANHTETLRQGLADFSKWLRQFD